MSHLSCGQQEVARKILREDFKAFAMDDDDIGCVEDLELEINLVDKITQLKKTYNLVPKPLYGEVKSHLQDMINRQSWLNKQLAVSILISSSVRA